MKDNIFIAIFLFIFATIMMIKYNIMSIEQILINLLSIFILAFLLIAISLKFVRDFVKDLFLNVYYKLKFKILKHY